MNRYIYTAIMIFVFSICCNFAQARSADEIAIDEDICKFSIETAFREADNFLKANEQKAASKSVIEIECTCLDICFDEVQTSAENSLCISLEEKCEKSDDLKKLTLSSVIE